MNDHFIKYIEIKDFKCFDDFKTEGLAQVNLIGGKNNVGKTAFMEACYVNIYAQDVTSFTSSLVVIKFRREKINDLQKNFNKKDQIKKYLEKTRHINCHSNINNCYFLIDEKSSIKKYCFSFYTPPELPSVGAPKYFESSINDFSYELKAIDNIIFIDSFGFNNKQTIKRYSFIQKKDKESYLNASLNKLDSRIQAFKVIDDKPQCKINGQYLEVTELGDGVGQLIIIAISLYASENGYLFIDEINNGIHYSMLDHIWEIILTLSKELNVQVFATTHSKECIESYGRVTKKLEQKNINYMKLVRKKSGEIVAANYDYDLFQSTLEQDHEVRGW